MPSISMTASFVSTFTVKQFFAQKYLEKDPAQIPYPFYQGLTSKEDTEEPMRLTVP